MNFVNLENLKNATYKNYPFPHTVIDNFLNEDKLKDILFHVNKLKDMDAQNKLTSNPLNQYNKFGFTSGYGDYLKKVFVELNSPSFIKHIENLTGIKNIIANNITLKGAGIHRVRRGGYVKMHTDFNSYTDNGTKLDRRINLLIYLNDNWKEEYGGELCLYDKENKICVKKIIPIINRCVIFNTTNKSMHGHPKPLMAPENIPRQSIAIYYYTKNTNGDKDFEGRTEHSTLWHPNINV